MANLGPLYQNATYSNLLQVDGGLTATLKPVLDGDGNASGLSLGLNSVSISGLVAESASNLYLGEAGSVPYQSAPSTTAFTAAGSAGQVLTSNGVHAPTWSTLTASGIGALASDGSIPMTGQLSLGYNKIVQVGAPADDYDAANKGYVDSVATGLQVKTACRVATTANLSLTGAATVDGVAVATSDRVLVKNQTASAENGIYVANTSGAWTRATDANTWAELVGAAAFITAGSTQANTTWVTNIAAGGTLGTDPITFVQFGASTAYTAGTGLTLTGSQFALSSPVSIANGGTGQTTQANAINALLPSQTGYSGRFLSTDGTQAYWSLVSPYNPAAVAITGGTIDGTTIGGSTPAAGTFTDLTASGTGTVDLKSFITVNATAAFLRNPRIWDTSQTNWYRITPSELSLDVYATLPALTGNDTFVFAGHAQTLTNKTLTSPAISGGTISGITDLAIADGGTGASDAVTARSNLGLAIGTNVQAYNAGLADIAGLAKTDSNFIVGNGTNWVAESGATARTSLGLGTVSTINTTGSTSTYLRGDGTWATPAAGQFINVMDYGAVADNSTNNYTAFTNAIAAAIAAKKPLFIPGGSYVIGSQIYITTPLDIYSDLTANIRFTNSASSGFWFNFGGNPAACSIRLPNLYGPGISSAFAYPGYPSSWTGSSRYGTAVSLTGGYCQKVFVNWINGWDTGVLFETASVSGVTAGNIDINIGNIDLCAYGVYLKSIVSTTGIDAVTVTANTVFAKYPLYINATYAISGITVNYTGSVFANETGGSAVYLAGTQLYNSTIKFNNTVAGYWGDSPLSSTTSASSASISTGSKTFILNQAFGANSIVVGSRITIANTSSLFMEGVVTSYSSTTLVVTIDAIHGSGTYSSWYVYPSVVPFISGNQTQNGESGFFGGTGNKITIQPDIIGDNVGYAGASPIPAAGDSIRIKDGGTLNYFSTDYEYVTTSPIALTSTASESSYNGGAGGAQYSRAVYCSYTVPSSWANGAGLAAYMFHQLAPSGAATNRPVKMYDRAGNMNQLGVAYNAIVDTSTRNRQISVFFTNKSGSTIASGTTFYFWIEIL